MSTTTKRDDPDLWEKVKCQVSAGDKGGQAGQWSARKAQLAVGEYKKAGGGYIGREKSDNSLRTWTREDWGTRSGRLSVETHERYLPRQARAALSAEEYGWTTAKKRSDTRRGRQFSSQPEDVASKARPFREHRSKAHLYEQAKTRGLRGDRG